MASTLKVNTIQHTGGTTGLTIDSGGRIINCFKTILDVEWFKLNCYNKTLMILHQTNNGSTT